MNVSRRLVFGIVGAGVLGVGLAGWAQDVAQTRREVFAEGRHGARLDWMTRELGLTEAQGSEIRALRQRDEAAHKDRWTRERALHEELDKLIAAPEPDRAAIAEKTRALSELRGQSLEAHVDQRIAFRQILTPEQRAKLDARRAEHKGRHDRVRHRFGRRHAEPPAEAPKL